MGCWLSWWYFLILYKYSQMLKNNEGKELQKKKKAWKESRFLFGVNSYWISMTCRAENWLNAAVSH